MAIRQAAKFLCRHVIGDEQQDQAVLEHGRQVLLAFSMPTPENKNEDKERLSRTGLR